MRPVGASLPASRPHAVTTHRLPAAKPYIPRTIRYLDLASAGGSTLKRYLIYQDEPPAQHSIDAATAVATHALAVPRHRAPIAGIAWGDLPEHGVGSLIVHRGREAVFALLHWWVDDNMLREAVWAAPLATPTTFTSLAPTQLAVCVWELAVVAHERAAWLTHVLQSPTPDREAYLADTLTCHC
jgi:hypothetical protein